MLSFTSYFQTQWLPEMRIVICFWKFDRESSQSSLLQILKCTKSKHPSCSFTSASHRCTLKGYTIRYYSKKLLSSFLTRSHVFKTKSTWKNKISKDELRCFNPLCANPAEFSNTQTTRWLLPTNCLSVFDHFVGS